MSKEELAREFSVIYKTNWPWQIREIDEDSFLVKFPPHISVEQVAGYPCFGLPSMDFTVNVEVWKEELANLDELVKVWVQVRGLLHKWCEWTVLDQCTSTFGMLVELDWQSMLQCLFEHVRVKMQCRDPTKKFLQRGVLNWGADLQSSTDCGGAHIQEGCGKRKVQ